MTLQGDSIIDLFRNRSFANFFSSAFFAGATSYALNLLLAWKLGIQDYAQLTVFVLFAFFAASLSELGFNQFYIARMSNRKTLALKYMGIRLIFAIIIYLFCITIGVADANVLLGILICAQAAVHVLNSSLEKNDAFSYVSKAAYCGATCRLIFIAVLLQMDTLSVAEALTYLVAVVCVQVVALTIAFALVSEMPLLAKEPSGPVSKVYVVSSFVLFLCLGRLDLLFLDYLDWGTVELNAIYFTAVGILFPLNQLFQVFARYSLVSLQKRSVNLNYQIIRFALLALVLTSLSIYTSTMFLVTSISVLTAKVLIFSLIAAAYLVSGMSAIFALGIYSADNGLQLIRMALTQFLGSLIFISLSHGDLVAIGISATILLANSIGCAIVVSQYKRFDAKQNYRE